MGVTRSGDIVPKEVVLVPVDLVSAVVGEPHIEAGDDAGENPPIST